MPCAKNTTKKGRKNRHETADFPLTRHPRGYWCKKVRGKIHYFGKIGDDPEGEKAVNQWLDQKDDLLAGRPEQGCKYNRRRGL